MKISFLCSNPKHPVNKYIMKWKSKNNHKHKINLVRAKKDLCGGDLLFLISCSEIVEDNIRNTYNKCLVIHASDLPHGRGWSPHIWEIINGGEEIVVSLLEAENKVDSGAIWHQIKFEVPKNALWDEINKILFETEIKLIDFAVNNFELVTPKLQKSVINQTIFPKRSPLDSQIDPYVSIESQFNKIRVCDPERFPAYFELHGFKYKLIIQKICKVNK